MSDRADDVTVAYPLFQEGGGGPIPTSALDFRLVKIPFATARKLNSLWHSVLPLYREPPCGQLCWAAEFAGVYYAVAIWTHPIARCLPQKTWLELRRLAISPLAPDNTGSRLLGVMARLIRRERPEIEQLVSYQDTVAHKGTIYLAAGWIKTVLGDGHQWHSSARTRLANQSGSPKQRWEKSLKENA